MSFAEIVASELQKADEMKAKMAKKMTERDVESVFADYGMFEEECPEDLRRACEIAANKFRQTQWRHNTNARWYPYKCECGCGAPFPFQYCPDCGRKKGNPNEKQADRKNT